MENEQDPAQAKALVEELIPWWDSTARGGLQPPTPADTALRRPGHHIAVGAENCYPVDFRRVHR